MSIRASCVIWESSWPLMLALSPERNRHARDGRCEANPHDGFTGQLRRSFESALRGGIVRKNHNELFSSIRPQPKIDGYRILEQLGAGGAADVYLATPVGKKDFAK